MYVHEAYQRGQIWGSPKPCHHYLNC